MPDPWALLEAKAEALLEVEDGGRCGHRSRWTPRVEVEVLLEVEAENGGQCDALIQGATWVRGHGEMEDSVRDKFVPKGWYEGVVWSQG